MQVSEAGDLKKTNDSQADENKEMQVSEAGDSKKLMVHKVTWKRNAS